MKNKKLYKIKLIKCIKCNFCVCLELLKFVFFFSLVIKVVLSLGRRKLVLNMFVGVVSCVRLVIRG